MERIRLQWERDVEEFASEAGFDTLKSYREERLADLGLERRNSAEAASLMAFADRPVVLQAAKRSPTRRQVENWLAERRVSKRE